MVNDNGSSVVITLRSDSQLLGTMVKEPTTFTVEGDGVPYTFDVDASGNWVCHSELLDYIDRFWKCNAER